MNKKKVGIIGIRGLPAQYGAFDQFVDQFIKYCNTNKKKFLFYISSQHNLKKKEIENVFQFYFYRDGGISILLYSLISLLYFYIKGVRTFLFFGYTSVIFFPLLNFLNCKVICNVDGIEWRRKNSILKKNYFKFCEKLLSKVKVHLIFDSIVIKRYYNKNHKVDGQLLYYPSYFENEQLHIRKKNNIRKFKVTVVMRFLPENNIKEIVQAFIELNRLKIKNHKLYLIGKENDYFKKEIKPMILNNKNIIFIGAIYDRKKLFRLWNSSDYYIHGHSVGGTNPTLVEAISLKLPTIAFNCSFNRAILGNKGSFFNNYNDLVEIIKKEEFFNQELKIDFGLFKRDFINEQYVDLIKRQ